MIWNNFLSKFGAGSGVWCEIILGLGARSAQPFAPATKSLWYALGDYVCFKIVAGGHLGLLRVNMSDIFAKGLEVRKIASAMMFFVTRQINCFLQLIQMLPSLNPNAVFIKHKCCLHLTLILSSLNRNNVIT